MCPFLDRALRSVEVSNGVEGLRRKLRRIGDGGELRVYMMSHYLVLYARFSTTLYFLSIKYHHKISFDFDGHWAQDK